MSNTTIKAWAIEKRKQYKHKLDIVKQTKPNSIQEQIVLGAKLRMLKEVIDQCIKYESLETEGEDESIS